MIQKILSYIRQYQIIKPQDKLIAGVSGGADSVCLFLVLMELKKQIPFDLEVVHVEHGIRGEDSLADAEFTKQLCEKYNVPCHVIHVDVPGYSNENGLGTEEAARLLRYEAFVTRARQINAKIALAHHEEDNAETVLFQLIRGSGIHGISGMSPVRDDNDGIKYIRPLLCVSRGEIEAYLEDAKQDYCTDKTNFETEYDRNRIRHVIIPELSLINNQASRHINDTASKLSLIEDYLAGQVAGAVDEMLTISDEGLYRVNIEKLSGLHPAIKSEAVLDIIGMAAGRKKDISAIHVEQVLQLAEAQSGKSIDLPYSLNAYREYEDIIISKRTDASEEEEYYVSKTTLNSLMESGEEYRLTLENGASALTFRVFGFDGDLNKIPKKAYTKWLCYDKIKDRFCVRKRQSHDYFISDSKGHRKKLKEYFINEKIPLSARDDIWLLTEGHEVALICGGRLSEAYKVTADTKYILEVHFDGGIGNGFFKEV